MPLEISQVHLEEFLVRLMYLLVQLDRSPAGLFVGVPEFVKLKILDSVIINNTKREPQKRAIPSTVLSANANPLTPNWYRYFI